MQKEVKATKFWVYLDLEDNPTVLFEKQTTFKIFNNIIHKMKHLPIDSPIEESFESNVFIILKKKPNIKKSLTT